MEMGLASTGDHVAGEINAGEVTCKPEKIKLKALIPESQALALHVPFAALIFRNVERPWQEPELVPHHLSKKEGK